MNDNFNSENNNYNNTIDKIVSDVNNIGKESYETVDLADKHTTNQHPKVSDLVSEFMKSGNDGFEEENHKENFISVKNVSKKYDSDSISTAVLALDDISFDIAEGELVIFLGQSGAGKTTALNLLGGMDVVTSGSITVGDFVITDYNLDALTEYRKNDIGFIFQSYNLIQNLTIKENIDLSTQIKKVRVDASEILDKVGLKHKLNYFPAQLSGGEQQRVAIARAIAKKPMILLCDEPTGALDYRTGKQILSLLQKTCKEEHVTTIIITHNQQVVDIADKIICFNSGKISKVIKNDNPIDPKDLEW